MSLTGVCSLSWLGEGRLEIRGHGHWQDLPLDVCPGVHTGISRTLPAPLVGWNDLEAGAGARQKLTRRLSNVLSCLKIYRERVHYLSSLLFLFLLFDFSPTVKLMAESETRLNIYWQHRHLYELFMWVKGQQPCSPSTPDHFDIPTVPFFELSPSRKSVFDEEFRPEETSLNNENWLFLFRRPLIWRTIALQQQQGDSVSHQTVIKYSWICQYSGLRERLCFLFRCFLFSAQRIRNSRHRSPEFFFKILSGK